MTIPLTLERWALTRPDERFCTFLAGKSVTEITFAQLQASTDGYARYYANAGVQRGDLIAIVLEHTPELFSSFLGAMAIGAVPAFLPFPSPKQRVELYWGDHAVLFDRIKPRMLVTYESNARAARASIPDFAIPIAIAGETIARAQLPKVAQVVAGEDDVALLQHSSGTTGLKKGVALTHRAISAQVDAYARAIAFGPTDSIVSWLPLYHDMGLIACLMMSLLRGTHLVALDPFEWVMRPGLLLDAAQRYKTTFCWLPNFAFSHIVRTVPPERQWDLSAMRAFVDCSEPCKPATFDGFLARFAQSGVTAEKLHVCYALAENVFAATQTPLGRPATRLLVDDDALSQGRCRMPKGGSPAVELLSCGRAIDGVRLQIRSEQGGRVWPGTIGEIVLESPFLFREYEGLPEATRERLRNGRYFTGDLGFLHKGELYVTGRKDDMLIVNGRNYYAHDIEAIVNAVPAVLPGRSVAMAVDDPELDAAVLVVLAESSGSDAATARNIRDAIFDHLGVQPHAVTVLPPGKLVKTTSGKISRTMNKKLFLQGSI